MLVLQDVEVVMMNHESLEAWEGYGAREYNAHQATLKRTLLLGIIILITAMYVLFFVGNPYKWPLLGTLAFTYLIVRFL